LDARLGDVLFTLQSCATTETLVGVMKGMGDIMKNAHEKMDMKDIQKSIEVFNMETEK